ncbi:MAG: hypothetical protein ACYDHY_09580 [Acidiferrobacterales bacterium]
MTETSKRPRLSTVRYRPVLDDDVEPAGYSTLHSIKSIAEFIQDLKQVLSGIHSEGGGTALELAESLFAPGQIGKSKGKDVPDGEPFAAMMHGTSEGYLVLIFVKTRYGLTAEHIVTVKYLSDRNFAYRVAREINEALEEGAYRPDMVSPGAEKDS